ncbi:MAG: outer membrane lipoprotein-sorting protein [Opitutales bacterium]
MDFPTLDGNRTTSVLLRNGPEPTAWRLDAVGGKPRPLDQKDLFAPLASGIDYSAFDALMPFVHWQNFSYRGSGRVIGRPAHLFECVPPEEVKEARPDLKYVRVAVDDAYNALLRVEFFGNRGVVDRKFSVVGFKKVRSGEDAYWIVKTIDLVDTRSRDKTRLRIEAAAVNLSLGPDTFRKENLARSPQIPKEEFIFFD